MISSRHVLSVLTLCLVATFPAAGQERAVDLGGRLLERPAVRAAIAYAADHEPEVIEDQVRVCQIAAPPFGESERAMAYAEEFRRLGELRRGR